MNMSKLLNRVKSYEEIKLLQGNCNECTSFEKSAQYYIDNVKVGELPKLKEYSLLSEEEIEDIIKELYWYKDEKTKNFIRKGLRIYKNAHDYSLTEYINQDIEVTIICREHGKFNKTPHLYFKGYECHECKNIKIRNKTIIECAKKFIKDSIDLYGLGTYDYSTVVYVDSHTRVWIGCKKHNVVFDVTPNNHLFGCGCPICKYEKVTFYKVIDFDEFLIRARKIHGMRYEYVKESYIGYTEPMTIICKKHGSFPQAPINHIWMKQGCPYCNSSHGEEFISSWLLNHNIEFVRQYRFNDCRDIRPLPFDFYLPKYNLCIEFDGEQHYKKTNFTSKLSEEKLQENFEYIKKHDKIKNEYCISNNINLIRISYKDDIEEKLKELFPNNLTIFDI